MRTKKAEFSDAFLKAIEVMGLLIVAMLIVKGFLGQTEDNLYHKTCMNSVRMNAKFDLDHSSYGDNINCPLVVESRSEKTKDEAMDLLADRWVMLFDEFEQGKADPFVDKYSDSETPKDRNFCLFRFVEDFKQGDKLGEFNLNDLVSHMSTKIISREGKELTVIEYITNSDPDSIAQMSLQPSKGVNSSGHEFSLKLLPMNFSKPLVVGMLFKKHVEKNDNYKQLQLIGAGVGVALFIVAGLATGGAAWIVFGAGIAQAVLVVSAAGAVAGGFVGGYYGPVVAIELSKYSGGYTPNVLDVDSDITIFVMPFDEQAINDMDCTKLPAEQEAWEGLV